MKVKLNAQGIQIVRPSKELVSLDVCFNGRRIWSFSVKDGRTGNFQWPQSLSERLYGTSDVEVRDSASGTPYAAARLAFDSTPEEFELSDAEGRPLMLNKWLRLAPALTDGTTIDRRDELVEILAYTRDVLQGLGYQVFAVGGTALGPYRDGDFLPHDDDGDLAVFFDTDQPVDVARETLKIQRGLRNAGFRVRAHSHAHLQVYPNLESIDSKLYVDVFAAFLKDGTINQPFHVRGPFTYEQLLPFAEVKVRGERFPVPADTEAWLATNYDDNWRTPQPGWKLKTPRSTVRRFRN